MSIWSRDFERTYAAYDGTLPERSCDYCGRDILWDEKAKRHPEYGRVCLDCVDIIREELRIWKQK